MRRVKASLLAISLLAAVTVGATAGAQTAPPLSLRASTKHPGRIGLRLSGPPGAELDVAEGDRAVGHATLDAAGAASLPEAGTWSCRTRDRSFTATGTAPDGTPLTATTAVRTPGCAHRYAVATRPRRPRAGTPTTVTVADRFRLPVRGRVCARGPARLKTCGEVRNRRARLRFPRTGRWRITFANAHRTLTVRRKPGHLRLLATGDSMIQIVDGFLEQRLAPRDVGVRSDARISTGLSKPGLLNWPAHARKQVRSYHPDLTIVFIGANDGYPFGKTPCCGKAWQRRYAKVASGMMRTYARGGAGTVFWCLLPAPRDGTFRRVFVAVNAALRRAAASHRGTVHLIDLPRTFTPGFRYRKSMNGHEVRQDDGVHLNVRGASIGADVMIRALRRAGQL